MAEHRLGSLLTATPEDLELVGISSSAFREEVEQMGEELTASYIVQEATKFTSDIPALRKRWEDLEFYRDTEINILSPYQDEKCNSIYKDIENVIVPLAAAAINPDSSPEYESEALDLNDTEMVEGGEMKIAPSMSDFSSDVRRMLLVGTMFGLHDTFDEMRKFFTSTKSGDILGAGIYDEVFRDHHLDTLFFRTSEIMVRANGICWYDFHNVANRRRISNEDQFAFVTNLKRAQTLEEGQSEHFYRYPTIAQASLLSAKELLDLFINCPSKELFGAASSCQLDERVPLIVGANRFIAVADHITRLRGVIYDRLLQPSDSRNLNLVEMVQSELGSDNLSSRAFVVDFLGLNDPEKVRKLYAATVGESRYLAELAINLARELPNRPYLIPDDLSVMYDPNLEVGNHRGVTAEEMQAMVKSCAFYSQRNVVFDAEDVLFSGIDLDQLKAPKSISILFDQNTPYRKFSVRFEYDTPEEEVRALKMAFDLNKGGFKEWNVLGDPTEDSMKDFYEASLAACASALKIAMIVLDGKAQERLAQKRALVIDKPLAPTKKGEYVPAPKFPNGHSRQPESILATPVLTTEEKANLIRDVIVIPKGDRLAKLLKGLKGQPPQVMESVLEQLRDFNSAVVQVGIEPLKNGKRFAPVSKWGCRTSRGEIRALLVRAGFKETDKGRIRFWNLEALGRRAGFYRDLAEKYGFDSKDV